MIEAFDRIVIDVPNLEKASEEYASLLGSFTPRGNTAGLALGNVGIELRQHDAATEARISSLAFLDTDLRSGEEAAIEAGTRNISLLRSHSREASHSTHPTATGIYAVDHLVLQTRDADGCIGLLRDQLGLRLALDQEVPEWGGRMLFFRMGKMTLEVIHNLKQPPEHDFFWGITFLCRDLEQTIAALDERGVDHSPIRPGRKPGTRVATVKSHCLGLPTLLIGHE